MNNRTQLDQFEQLIAAELERFVAGANDPKATIDIAGAAMRPRGALRRAATSRNARRLLLLGIAAVLAVSAAYVGALRLQVRNDIAPPTAPPPTPLALHTTPVESFPPLQGTYQAVVTRQVPEGIAVYLIRADGGERLLTTVLNTDLPNGGTMSGYAKVSTDGYLALENQLKPWPMVLADLGSSGSTPWMVNEASTGGISPVWGPTNLVAADAVGSGLGFVIVADPKTRTVTHVNDTGALIGGGPSIFWTSDAGILIKQADGKFKTHHLDGSPDTPGFPALADSRNIMGPGGSTLTLCEPGSQECPVGSSVGGVRLLTLDGVSQPVYAPAPGQDRVVAAGFGVNEGDYWLLLDHSGGRQLKLTHQVRPGDLQSVATIDRASDWGLVYLGANAPDESLLSLTVDRGVQSDQPGTVVIDATTGQSAFHEGFLAGFVSTSALANLPGDNFVTSQSSIPRGGERYQLPSADDLVAADVVLNPGHVAVTKASRDGEEGSTAEHTYTFTADEGGQFDLYLNCFGPSNVVVTTNGHATNATCGQPGGTIDSVAVAKGDELTVDATGDTSWRVVLYRYVAAPGDTPAPVAQPVN